MSLAHQPGPSRRLLLTGAPALALAGCQGDRILPDIERPPLLGLTTHTGWAMPGFGKGAFRGRVAIINFWASWCGYCRAEHALLKTLEQRLSTPLYGLVHLDRAEPAARYLREAGNPFRAVAHDEGDRMGRAIGQRGVPSTHVVGHDGLIVATWGGGLSEDGIERVLRPGIEKARRRMVASTQIG